MMPMSKRILVVEDNPMNLKLFAELLTIHGYDFLVAENGMDALKLIQEQSPRLVLLDLQLPDISGFDVLRQIKENDATKAIPVIAVTAFAMQGDEERALSAGCVAYITKPISVATFHHQIERALEAAGAEHKT